MGKRGRRTPKAVEDCIVEIARVSPSLSQGQIAERVENELGAGARVDKSTVGRILKRAKLGRAADSGAEDSLLARESHWPALRQIAEELRAQGNVGVPFAQVLGFPWRSLDYNGGLVISRTGSGNRVSLTSEKSQLFGALKEHLPSHPAWDTLKTWERQVRSLHSALIRLCELVTEEPELRGRPWITREDIEQGAEGHTDFFPRSIVLERAEQTCEVGPGNHEFEIIAPSKARRTVLRWTRYSSSYVDLAASINADDVGKLEKMHREIGEQLLTAPGMATLKQAYRRLLKTTKALDSHLERIGLLVKVPGSCSLYSDRMVD